MRCLHRTTALAMTMLMAISILSCGCRKSEYRSVQTYEYHSEPPPPQPPYTPDPIERQMSNELDSEYKMVSPGEMRGR